MNIDTLYEKAFTDEICKNPDKFIEFVNPHIDLINNTEINGNSEMHDKVLRLIANHAHNLTIRESFKKAQPHLDKAISLFQSHPEYKEKELLTIPFYEILIFDRAVVKYRLKDYKSSDKDLKLLTSKFPDNDKYKSWLASAQTYKLQNYFKYVWYTILAVVLFTTFFDKEDIGQVYNLIVLIIGGIALLLAIPFEIIIRLKKRKIKNGG